MYADAPAGIAETKARANEELYTRASERERGDVVVVVVLEAPPLLSAREAVL